MWMQAVIDKAAQEEKAAERIWREAVERAEREIEHQGGKRR
jgi:hypothetical protein